VKRLQPRDLSSELRREWNRIAGILADPAVDRLKPSNVDTIVEYCRATVRLRNLRASFVAMAEQKAAATGGLPDPLDAEIYRVESRNGEQVKAHPHVAQINETWRQWRSLAAALGLSPADGRNMIPGQGEQFDESEEFA
jgi:P27 family predicted phage terminase small subunit